MRNSRGNRNTAIPHISACIQNEEWESVRLQPCEAGCAPGTTGERTDQQLEEPETGLVVAGLEGVDEEEHHEAVEDERVDLHGEVGVLRVQAGEDAEAPQNTQETGNLQQTHRKK